MCFINTACNAYGKIFPKEVEPMLSSSAHFSPILLPLKETLGHLKLHLACTKYDKLSKNAVTADSRILLQHILLILKH